MARAQLCQARFTIGPLIFVLLLAFVVGAGALFSSDVLAQTAPERSAKLTGAVPLSRGDVLLDRFQVESLKRHREFVRIRFTDTESATQTVVEIGVGRQDPWSTTHYRVQPAPGSSPPPPLLRGLLKALKAWEAQPEHIPFVKPHEPGSDVATETVRDGVTLLRPHASRHANPVPPPLGVPLMLLGLFGLLLIWACCGAGPRGRLDRLLFAIALGAAGACLSLIDPLIIPTSWITLIHEGSVERLVAALYGHGNHGPLQDTLRWLYGPTEAAPIRAVMVLQLALTAVQAIGLIVLCQRITMSLPAGLLIGAAATLNPLVVNAALSELPAPLVHVLWLMWAVAFGRRGHAPKAAWTAMITISALLGATRPELGLLAGIATTGSALDAWLRAKPKHPGHHRRVVWGISALMLIGIGGLLHWLSRRSEELQETWVYLQVPALDVIHPGVLTWPIAMAAVLPMGIAILALIGWVTALSERRALALGALGFILLYRLYWASAHEGEAPYEVARYLSLLAMPIALMAAMGWHWSVAQSKGKAGHRVLVSIMALSCVLPLPEQAVRHLLWGQHASAEGALLEMPLSRLQQIEARALLTSWESYPECVIATVSARDPKPTHPPKAYDYVLFGEPLIEPLSARRLDSPIGPWVQQHVPGVPCVIFHRGIDCHVDGGPACESEAAQGLALSRFEVQGRPYYDHLTRRAPVSIERYQLRIESP